MTARMRALHLDVDGMAVSPADSNVQQLTASLPEANALDRHARPRAGARPITREILADPRRGR